MNIEIVEVDYSTPLEIRERLNFHTSQIQPVINDLKNETSFKESFFMCTCNRTLLIYVCDSNELNVARKSATALFSRWANVEIPAKDFKFFQGEQAFEKLMTLSVGAESAMFGEDQIMAQIKLFYKVALHYKISGPFLNRVIQNLLFAGRKIRLKYPISRGAVSIPGIVSKAISEDFLESGSPVRILIIGWGDITHTIYKILKSHGDRYEIVVSNRTLGKVHLDTKKIPISEIRKQVRSFDVIISMVSRLGYIVSSDDLGDRTHRLVFDLGVPRNIDPEVSRLKNIKMFDIDDVNEKSGLNSEDRKKALSEMMKGTDFFFFQQKMLKFMESYEPPLSSRRTRTPDTLSGDRGSNPLRGTI